MSDELTAPSEGSAKKAGEIADELSAACDCLRTVDYNALTPEQLGDTLAAFNTLQDLCLHFREQAPAGDRHRKQDDDEEVVDLGDEHGEAEPTDE